MPRRGEALIGTLAVLMTASAVTLAEQTGYIGPFADVFVLGVMWWLIRAVGDVKVILAGQPTKGEVQELATVVRSLDLKLARNLDTISNRATEVIFGVEERTTVRADDEARRRHQLRQEVEQRLELAESRLTQHGEKIAELGAIHGKWPKRKGRDA